MNSKDPLKLPPEFEGLTQEQAIRVAKGAKKLIQAHRRNVAARNQSDGDKPEIADIWFASRPRQDHATMPWLVDQIVSGGQTGVDRAALDAAIELGIPHGGWCPSGRLAEDGPLDVRYRLRETDGCGYRQRTRLNVADSDGTLILNEGKLSTGTALTTKLAVMMGKPHLIVCLDAQVAGENGDLVRTWCADNAISVLNVAGPGERKRPGIYDRSLGFLLAVLVGTG